MTMSRYCMLLKASYKESSCNISMQIEVGLRTEPVTRIYSCLSTFLRATTTVEGKRRCKAGKFRHSSHTGSDRKAIQRCIAKNGFAQMYLGVWLMAVILWQFIEYSLSTFTEPLQKHANMHVIVPAMYN